MKTGMIFLTLLSFLLAACTMDVNLQTEADQVAAAAAEIADFDLPAGYHPEFAAGLKGYTVISYQSSSRHGHLYLVQSENAEDAARLEQALDELFPGTRSPKTRSTVIANQPVVVRGQETTLVLSEGINGDGELYRQALVSFAGNKGPALLIVSAPAETWDLTAADALLTSLH